MKEKAGKSSESGWASSVSLTARRQYQTTYGARSVEKLLTKSSRDSASGGLGSAARTVKPAQGAASTVRAWYVIRLASPRQVIGSIGNLRLSASHGTKEVCLMRHGYRVVGSERESCYCKSRTSQRNRDMRRTENKAQAVTTGGMVDG